jgi:5-methylcytosine-specific restriction endonuclease McrA
MPDEVAKARRKFTSHQRYLRNREAILAQNAAWRKANPERMKELVAAWNARNPERVKQLQHEGYERNKETVLQRSIERRKNNPKRLEYEANYKAAHKAEQALVSAKWSKEHPAEKRASVNKRRASKLEVGGSYTASEWRALKDLYGFRCLCCGKAEPRIKLTVDHVVPLSKGGVNDISNIQPLCLSCNCTKSARSTDYRPSAQLAA